MKKILLIIPIFLLILIGAGCDNQTELIKEQQEQIKDLENNVELFYNKRTGELYPLLPNGNNVHTCVWTIWGDHGSEIKLVTDVALIDENTSIDIKSNNFLPPRVPIYVTCVDWENNSYQGKIGEYKNLK